MRFLGCLKAWSCILGNVGTCFCDLRERKVYLSCVLVQNWDTEQKLCYNKCPFLSLNITPVTLHPSAPPPQLPPPCWTNADFQGLSLQQAPSAPLFVCCRAAAQGVRRGGRFKFNSNRAHICPPPLLLSTSLSHTPSHTHTDPAGSPPARPPPDYLDCMSCRPRT